MNSKTSIYIAGPISGKSYKEASEYFINTKLALEKLGYCVFSPLTGKDYLRNETKLKAAGYNSINPISSNHAIYNRDQWMSTKRADIIYCNLSQADRISIGSMFELAWGSYTGKHIIIAIGKKDLSNPHFHAFVLEAGDIIFETHAEAIAYLTVLAKGL